MAIVQDLKYHFAVGIRNKLVSLIKIMTSVATGKTMDDGVEGKLSV